MKKYILFLLSLLLLLTGCGITVRVERTQAIMSNLNLRADVISQKLEGLRTHELESIKRVLDGLERDRIEGTSSTDVSVYTANTKERDDQEKSRILKSIIHGKMYDIPKEEELRILNDFVDRIWRMRSVSKGRA